MFYSETQRKNYVFNGYELQQRRTRRMIIIVIKITIKNKFTFSRTFLHPVTLISLESGYLCEGCLDENCFRRQKLTT